MDPENIHSRLKIVQISLKFTLAYVFIWRWELNLSIDTAGSEKSAVEDVDSICRHNNLRGDDVKLD